MLRRSCLFLAFTSLCCIFPISARRIAAPEPCGPVPTTRQLIWHKMQMYAFVHFTTTTYRDLEWGYGDAHPNEFFPTLFDCGQWMRCLKSAGLKGVIITAKHHDGFCLWPSLLTDYSVRNSRWRRGKGDVVGETARAARKYGMKFGIYLSPWDRHDLRYGTSAYLDYFRGQLKELLTNYGPVFEIWQDGANGGDGYYGGLKEKRIIDNHTYYDWAATDSLIRRLQPQTVIFSDGGPDARWCGNERGFIGDPNWNLITKSNYGPGISQTSMLMHGEEHGTDWVPAEVDVSIRPGWFFHDSENDKVKTPGQLLDIFYNSVGRGANLILNVPVDRRGLVACKDSLNLAGFGRLLKHEFANCINGEIEQVSADNVRGGNKRFRASNILKNNALYWATDDDVKSAAVTFRFKHTVTFNRFSVREHIELGQRIKSFRIEVRNEAGRWVQVAEGTTIGCRRILRLPDIVTSAVKLVIDDAKACPCIEEVKFFKS